MSSNEVTVIQLLLQQHEERMSVLMQTHETVVSGQRAGMKQDQERHEERMRVLRDQSQRDQREHEEAMAIQRNQHEERITTMQENHRSAEETHRLLFLEQQRRDNRNHTDSLIRLGSLQLQVQRQHHELMENSNRNHMRMIRDRNNSDNDNSDTIREGLRLAASIAGPVIGGLMRR